MGVDEAPLKMFLVNKFGTPPDYMYLFSKRNSNDTVELDMYGDIMVKLIKHLVFIGNSVYSVHYAVLHPLKLVVIDGEVTERIAYE